MNDDLFSVPASDDTIISGVKGSNFHAHETPFGCGSIADQSVENGSGRHVQTYNRFNQEVDAQLSNFPAFDSLIK